MNSDSWSAAPGRGLRALRSVLVAAITALGMLVAAGGASATTFCVPDFHAQCSDDGESVAEPSFQDALLTDRSDGEPDRIVLDAATIDQAGDGTGDGYALGSGGDPLEIVGAGPNQTTLTNETTGNNFAFNLNPATRPSSLELRDLTFEVPDTLDAGAGSAMQVAPGTLLERVDIRNTHDGTAFGISFNGVSGTFREGRIYSNAGVEVNSGIRVNNALGAGTVVIEGATIAARIPVDASPSGTTLNLDGTVDVKRSHLIGRTGAIVAMGGTASATNSILELIPRAAGSGVTAAVSVRSSSVNSEPPGAVTLDHVTIVAPPIPEAGSFYDGVNATVPGNADDDATAEITNSIISVPTDALVAVAPDASPDGDALIEVSHTSYPDSTHEAGDGEIVEGSGNLLDQDPMFTAPDDFHLLPGSPAIDAGDPGATGPQVDFDGLPRPRDGDGDGTPVRDMGAFELQTDDVTPPELAILGARLRLNRNRRTVIRLRCPATEESPPCAGRIRLQTRRKVRVGARSRKVRLVARTYQVDAGQTKTLQLRLSTRRARLVRTQRRARKVRAITRVRDQEGNSRLVAKPMKLVPRP